MILLKDGDSLILKTTDDLKKSDKGLVVTPNEAVRLYDNFSSHWVRKDNMSIVCARPTYEIRREYNRIVESRKFDY